MKNAAGLSVARLGDTTDHGGTVVEAATDRSDRGLPVALDGHRVHCPRCGGDFAILASGPATHHGRKVAHLGDKTTCGATLLPAG